MTATAKALVHYIWLIDGRHEIKEKVTQKIIDLAKVHEASVSVIYDRRLRLTERSYWFTLEKFESVNKEWTDKQDKRLAHVQQALCTAGVESSISTIEMANFLEIIHTTIRPTAENYLLLQNEKVMVQHPVFQELSSLPCHVYLLGEQPWQATPIIIGAVDPLHENARPQDLDLLITRQVQSLAKKFKSSWYITHACFIPPSFLQYKSKFIDIHRQGLNEFARRTGISEKHTILLQGIPERVIADWITKHSSDLLVIGSVARNKLLSHLIGSTTIALLESPPSDMLLLKSQSKN